MLPSVGVAGHSIGSSGSKRRACGSKTPKSVVKSGDALILVQLEFWSCSEIAKSAPKVRHIP